MRADEALAKSAEASFYLIGYYGHNLHFLAVYNALAGDSAHAIAAANKLYAHSERWMREVTQLDFFMVTPAMVLIQFGRWDDILALPEPLRGAAHRCDLALRAHAGVRRQKPACRSGDRARKIRQRRAEPAEKYRVRQQQFGRRDRGRATLPRRPPSARSRRHRGRDQVAARAVVAEDALAHDDPPAWYLSSRQALGAALMRARDFSDAEKIYREDLERNPESGRALFGLQAALAAQGRHREAGALQKRIDRAWRAADVKLGAAM